MTFSRHRRWPAVAASLLMGCGLHAPVHALDGPPSVKAGAALFGVSAAGEEASRLAEAVATTTAVLASARFWSDLRGVAQQYPAIFIGPAYRQDGLAPGMADAAGAMSLLLDIHDQYHAFAAVVSLTGTYYPQGDVYLGRCANARNETIDCRGTLFGQNYANKTVVTRGIGLIARSGREMVSVDIGREIFNRYNAGSVIEKSCTVNTLAHEWTHTIGKNQPRHWAVVVDSDPQVPAAAPKLSYLFGSVAQCSWLQGAGAIGGGEASLNACVARFGVSEFLSLQCR